MTPTDGESREFYASGSDSHLTDDEVSRRISYLDGEYEYCGGGFWSVRMPSRWARMPALELVQCHASWREWWVEYACTVGAVAVLCRMLSQGGP